MKQLAFAVAVLAFGFTLSSPARADFAVIQFEGGYCKIWWDSGDTPWGAGWRKIIIGIPNWAAATIALNSARAQGVCP